MYLICYIQCSLHGIAVINNSLERYWTVACISLRNHVSAIVRFTSQSPHKWTQHTLISAVKTFQRTHFEVMMNCVSSAPGIDPPSAHKQEQIPTPQTTVFLNFSAALLMYNEICFWKCVSVCLCTCIYVSTKPSCWVNKWLSGSSWWAVMICEQCSREFYA